MARDADAVPDTTEIRALTEAVGYSVVDAVTQRRREDPTYAVGRGKAEELMRRAAETDADAVVYDGELTPGQTAALTDLLPAGVSVLDRTRVVLDRFADGADSRAATLQVDLARLRYWKPRLRELIARDYADDLRFHNEDDRRVLDVERRIEATERALDAVTETRRERRRERREAGFDLVALAGYTNAGKSTLLRRLADDLDDPDGVPATGGTAAAGATPATGGDGHADVATAATVADRLFETLETTTRRATVGGRRLLVTDTVGFVDALPHEAVRSFRATIAATREADAVLLAVDATDAPDRLREKVAVSLRAVEETSGPVLPVLTKVDALAGPESIDARLAAVDEAAAALSGAGVPAADRLLDPVPVSALDGTGIDRLRERTVAALPTAETTLDLPNDGATQRLLAWAHDHGDVRDVSYEADAVRVRFAGRPDVVAEADRRAAALGE
ncbi:GTPase HflX [Haloparvum alkalitolerans]